MAVNGFLFAINLHCLNFVQGYNVTKSYGVSLFMLSMKKSICVLTYAVALLSTSSTVFAGATEMRRGADCCDNKTQIERQIVHKEKSVTAECKDKSAKDVSWGSWLVGSSRSTQFHYLDLLELLFRNDEQAVAAEPSSYK